MFNSGASLAYLARQDTFCAEPSTFARHVDYHDVDAIVEKNNVLKHSRYTQRQEAKSTSTNTFLIG